MMMLSWAFRIRTFWLALAAALFVASGAAQAEPRAKNTNPVSMKMSAAPGDAGFVPGIYLTVGPGGDAPANRATAKWLKDLLTADGHLKLPIRWGHGEPKAVAQAKASGKFKYHISHVRREDGILLLNFEKWIKDYDTDADGAGWVIGHFYQTAKAASLIKRALRAERELRLTYEKALAYGVQESASLKIDRGEYVLRQSGKRVEFREALTIFADEAPRQRHWLRMITEATLLLGVMETKYLMDKDLNAFDFEYEADWRNFRHRFVTFEAWRLDDNYYNTNSWRHPVQGAANYIFARSNGFGLLESYLISIAFSGAWEFFGEYKEEVSLNDMIVTPGAGFPIGEAFSQLGAFFLRGRSSWYNQVAGNVFSGGKGLMDWVDRNRRVRATSMSSLGFDETVWHRFKAYVSTGMQWATGGGAQAIQRAGFESEIITIPDFDKPGRAQRLYMDGAFSSMLVATTWGEQAKTDYRFFARAALIAWHRKNISQTDGNGYNLILAVSSAYEYGFHRSEGRDTHRSKDRVAIAHLAGPTIDLTVIRDGVRIRAVIDVYGDYAFVRNYAINEYRLHDPDAEVRSTILRDNYHHAWGITRSGRLIAGYGKLEAGLQFQDNLLKSVQVLDRHQEALAENYALDDSRTEGRLWVNYGVALGKDVLLKLELGLEHRKRSGTVKNTTQSDEERRYMGGVLVEF